MCCPWRSTDLRMNYNGIALGENMKKGDSLGGSEGISLMYTSKLSSASGHKSSFLGERSKAARPSFFSMAKRRNTRKSNQRLLNPVNVSMNHGRCLHTPSHIILPAIPLGKN